MIHHNIIGQMNEERTNDMRREADQQRLIKIAHKKAHQPIIHRIILAVLSWIRSQLRIIEKQLSVVELKLQRGDA